MTVVRRAQVLGGSSEGEECQVKMGRAFYTGKIMAVGKLLVVAKSSSMHVRTLCVGGKKMIKQLEVEFLTGVAAGSSDREATEPEEESEEDPCK